MGLLRFFYFAHFIFQSLRIFFFAHFVFQSLRFFLFEDFHISVICLQKNSSTEDIFCKQPHCKYKIIDWSKLSFWIPQQTVICILQLVIGQIHAPLTVTHGSDFKCDLQLCFIVRHLLKQSFSTLFKTILTIEAAAVKDFLEGPMNIDDISKVRKSSNTSRSLFDQSLGILQNMCMYNLRIWWKHENDVKPYWGKG